MFIVLLRFADNRAEAGRHMDGHRAWLRQGFDDGVFVLAGTLQPGVGGGVLAHGTSAEALRERVAADPFVAEHVVTAEILEIDPARADDRLAFLLPAA
ncbi:hypothetical protein [Thalassobaculum sp.]|uniref:YciI family protein n=1 Tax=Thalassobaculum sp. TaxID=2022740 RepID=UPI0032EBB128